MNNNLINKLFIFIFFSIFFLFFFSFPLLIASRGQQAEGKKSLSISLVLSLSPVLSLSAAGDMGRVAVGDTGRTTTSEAATPARVWPSVACGLRWRDEAPVLHGSKQRRAEQHGRAAVATGSSSSWREGGARRCCTA
jgi:hypothetical protein